MNLQMFRRLIIDVPILERLISHLGVRGISKLVCAHRELLRYDNLPEGSSSRSLLSHFFENVYQEIIKFRAGKVVLIRSSVGSDDVYFVNCQTPVTPEMKIPLPDQFYMQVAKPYRSRYQTRFPYRSPPQIVLAKAEENLYRQNVYLEMNVNGNLITMELNPKQIKRCSHDPAYFLPYHRGLGICFYPPDPPSLRPPLPPTLSPSSPLPSSPPPQTATEIADDHTFALQLAMQEGYDPFY